MYVYVASVKTPVKHTVRLYRQLYQLNMVSSGLLSANSSIRIKHPSKNLYGSSMIGKRYRRKPKTDNRS
jgi:hypothetical protein